MPLGCDAYPTGGSGAKLGRRRSWNAAAPSRWSGCSNAANIILKASSRAVSKLVLASRRSCALIVAMAAGEHRSASVCVLHGGWHDLLGREGLVDEADPLGLRP